MFIQLIFGTILIIITVLVHAIILDILLKSLERYAPVVRRTSFAHWKITVITITVVGVFAANTFEIWIWAVTFFLLDIEALATFESALYFSTSTFTTAGYGDVVLDEKWRLMGSFEAANGMILFGWSTAFIFDIVRKLYKDDDFGNKSKHT